MTTPQSFSTEAFITRPPSARLLSACSPPGSHDHTARMRVAGELDRATAPRLTEAIASASRGREALSSWAEHPAVRLDLSQLSFCDLGGITAIGEARAALLTNGFRLCLTRPPLSVLRLLDIAIFHGWLHPDVECSQLPWPVFSAPNRPGPTPTSLRQPRIPHPALPATPQQRSAGQVPGKCAALFVLAPPGDPS